MSTEVRASGGLPKKALERVQTEVNRMLTYQTDKAQYGVADVWVADPPSRRGDCEDYALTKRKRLLAMGGTADAIRVVLGSNWRGQPHAVLYARDVAGQWWILDNETGRVVRPRDHGFRPGIAGPYGEPAGAR